MSLSSETSMKMDTPAAKAPFRLGYRAGLNGLRGLAILIVFLVHGVGRLPGCLGFVGVDIFFVLSGFLITSLLIEEWEESRRISLGSFYMRRALRLFPALVVLLAAFDVYSLCAHPGWRHKVDLIEVRATAFYYMNWKMSFRELNAIYLRHTWSLSLEEQFYLLWPPLLFLLLRWTDRRSLLNFILLGIFCSVGWRWLSLAIENGRVDSWRMICGLDTRADSLLIGCATAVIISSGFIREWNWTNRALRISMIISLAGLLLIGLLFDDSQVWMYCIGWLLISLFAAAVIIALMSEAAGSMRIFFEAHWLVYLGVISYSLYLWHYPIFVILHEDYKLSMIATTLLGGCMSFVAALGSYYLIERPCLRLKKRFKKVGD